MADAVQQTSDTSGQVDAVDTSVDEGTDTSSLEDDDTSFEDEAGIESEATDTEEAATDSEDEATDESDTDVEETDTAKAEEADSKTDEEKQTDKTDESSNDAEERHQRNEEAKARRLADKQAKDQAKFEATQASLDNAYQSTYDQYIEAGYDDTQARLQARQALSVQQLQVDAYNNRVLTVQNKLHGDLNSAVSQIDLFRSDNPVIREAMYQAVDYYENMYVAKDENGDPIEIKGEILPFLQAEAERIQRLTGIGAKKQEQDKSNQRKRTLQTPTRTPAKPKVDPDLAAFDEVVNQGW